MQTIGFIGVGNIGMVICKHLIDSGHKVLGYRRSSLAEFEKIGGIASGSAVSPPRSWWASGDTPARW